MQHCPQSLTVVSTIMLLLLVAAMLSPDAPDPADHPHFAAMQIGGPRAEADRASPWGGGLFGALTVVLLSGCLLLPNAQDRSLRRAIACGAALYLSVYLAMLGLYITDASAVNAPDWGGFPRATVVTMFGLWVAPIAFTAIYCVGFRRWFTPAPTRVMEPAPHDL